MNNLGKNKKLLLAKYPNGLAEFDDFIAEEVEVPNIVDNEWRKFFTCIGQ